MREEINLSGFGWKMDKIRPGQGVEEGFHSFFPSIRSTRNWITAKVPGDVYTQLWRNGAIDDPYYGRNIEKTKWLIEYEWWYETTFRVPEKWKGKVIRLIFEGVDYDCEVWLNGERLGHHVGMFSEFAFDITDRVIFFGEDLVDDFYQLAIADVGRNANMLAVKIAPPPRDKAKVGGRKGHLSDYGSDYTQAFIMIGIWRPVKIQATGPVRIEDVYVKPQIRDSSSALLNIEVALENHTDTPKKVSVKAKVEGKNFISERYERSFDYEVKPGLGKFKMEMDIDEAKLWWPWDMGEQNLYRLTLTVNEDGKIYDESETSFGIREVKMEKNPGFTEDEVEYPWTFLINGKRHYLRSANWCGPPDLMYGRNTYERYRNFIKLAKEGNINNFRVWHSYPEIPEFYELCDEAGITVWQNFSFGVSVCYPQDEEFIELATKECIEVVKECRNHPCLVIWCGSEELALTPLSARCNKKLIFAIGDAIKPYTSLPYVPTTPLSTKAGQMIGFKSKESIHAVEHYYSAARVSMEEYYGNLDYAIYPEIAAASAPCVESIKKFIPPDELWPPGPSWGYHFAELDIFRNHNLEIFNDERTGSLEEFVNATQIVQGTVFKYAIECFRRKKPHVSGCSFCFFISPWPDFKWAVVDYYLKPKLSYYMIKTAYQPILVSLKYHKRRWMNGEDFEGSLWVVNDYHRQFKNCTIEMRITDKKRKLLKKESVKVAIEADSSKKFKDVGWKVPEDLVECFQVELSLKDNEGACISKNEYSFLIGDEEKARKKVREKAEEIMARRQRFVPWSYYRDYPSLL